MERYTIAVAVLVMHLLINAFALHVFSRHGCCFFFVSLFGVSILRTVYCKCDPGGGVTDPVVVDVHFGDLNVGRSSTCFRGKQWDSLQGVSVACFFGCKGEVTNIYVQSWATIVTVMMFS